MLCDILELGRGSLGGGGREHAGMRARRWGWLGMLGRLILGLASGGAPPLLLRDALPKSRPTCPSQGHLPVSPLQKGWPPLTVPETDFPSPTMGRFAPDSPWFCPVGSGSESPRPPRGPHNFPVAPFGALGGAEEAPRPEAGGTTLGC